MTRAIDENSKTEKSNFISNSILTGLKSFVEVNLEYDRELRKSSVSTSSVHVDIVT